VRINQVQCLSAFYSRNVRYAILQVKLWVNEWKVSTEQVQELYRQMHEAYTASGDS
jgi:hypothetical protein